MIMPYQVTLVPNFLVCGVSCNMLDTRRAIILPGNILALLSIFLLTKVMRQNPVSRYVEAAKT